jgi:hypothetical protein
MSLNRNNNRRRAPSAIPEEVDQILVNPGNSAGESSNTLSGPPQGSSGEINNPIDATGLSNDVDMQIDVDIAAVEAAERLLDAEVQTLQRKREIVDRINRRILKLENQKQSLRETLRFTTSSANSIREETPASVVLPSREAPFPEPEPVSYPEATGTDDSDLILPEPPYNILKTYLDREKSLKVRASEPYRGSNLKEWRTFISHWEGVFRTQPWTYNRHSARVYSAASYMKDEPHDAWEAALKQNPPARVHWESFSRFLANLIQAPQTRKQDAFEELRNLRQQDGESVSELYTRMVSLEVDQDQRPERDRVRTLDAALSNYKTKQMLVSILSGDEAASVNEWLEKAQKAEHVAHPKSSRNKGESSKGNPSSKDPEPNKGSGENDRRKRKERFRNRNRDGNSGGNSSRNGNSGGSSRPARTLPGTSSAKDITCYTCGQKGHYSSNTKCPKYDEWVKKNPEQAKIFEESRRLQRQVNEISKEERSRSASKDRGKAKASS